MEQYGLFRLPCGGVLAARGHQHPSTAEMGAFIDGPDYDMAVTQNRPIDGNRHLYRQNRRGLSSRRAGPTLKSWGPLKRANIRVTLILDRQLPNHDHRRGSRQRGAVQRQSSLLPDGTMRCFTPKPIRPRTGSTTPRPPSWVQLATFTGNQITVTSQDYNVDTTTGTWGGQFSNVNDGDGNPRAVAGTNAVYFNTTGGSEAIFTGAFYGATGPFE